MVDLLDEYRWGTFTLKLSRHQLHRIAAELPARSTWSEESFEQVRNDLKAKFELSNRELSKALSMIQERHEMAARIGIQVPIPGLSQSALEFFLDRWSQVNDVQLVINPPPPSLTSGWDINEVLEADRKLEASAEALAKEINLAELAPLRALLYFEDEAPVSEAFARLLAICQREMSLLEADPDVLIQSLKEMLENIRVFERILYSLDFLGQRDIVEHVIKRYGLEPARSRLLEKSMARKAVPTWRGESV